MFQDGRHDISLPLFILPCCHGFFHKGFIPSMPCRAVTIWFQALFTPRLGVLFSFPSRYIVRYRSWDVFRIGSRCLPASRPISNGRYSGDMTSAPLEVHLRGFNPLRRWHSSQTSTRSHGELYVSCPPQRHIPFILLWRVRFVLRRFHSPLLTASHVAFFSSAY